MYPKKFWINTSTALTKSLAIALLMDMPLTKKEIVLERNSVDGPPSAFRDLRTMSAAHNLFSWPA